MMDKKNRTESCVSEADFTPLVEVSESVPAEEFIQSVPMDVHKNKEVSDKVLNEGSDEDGNDEVFPEKTAEEKIRKENEQKWTKFRTKIRT